MSGTRSSFPKAAVISGAAILVSHGQPSEPELAEAELAGLRDDVRALAPDWTIASATLAQPEALDRALDQVGRSPFVYPLFMSNGWFTKTELKRRLASADARLLPPLGAEPQLLGVVADMLAQTLRARGWSAADTSLIVAAHGSGRSKAPSREARAFAETVQARVGFAALRIGYVEEPPFLAEAAARAGEQAICLPFFATRRGHVLEDLPDALSEAGFRGLRLDPVGLNPAIPGLIAQSLARARRKHAPA